MKRFAKGVMVMKVYPSSSSAGRFVDTKPLGELSGGHVDAPNYKSFTRLRPCPSMVVVHLQYYNHFSNPFQRHENGILSLWILLHNLMH